VDWKDFALPIFSDIQAANPLSDSLLSCRENTTDGRKFQRERREHTQLFVFVCRRFPPVEIAVFVAKTTTTADFNEGDKTKITPSKNKKNNNDEREETAATNNS